MVKKVDFDIDEIFSMKKLSNQKSENQTKDSSKKTLDSSLAKVSSSNGISSLVQKPSKSKKKNKKNSTSLVNKIANSSNLPEHIAKTKIKSQPQSQTTSSSTSNDSKIQKSKVQVIDATGKGSNPLNQHMDSQLKVKNPDLKNLKDDPFSDIRGSKPRLTDDNMRIFYYDDLKIGEGDGDLY
ncbi:hypothetical protein AYI70_g3641 [Smittium culicis]|uniref:Uncharacterized protein n=1 Tax=Smittium culicis TaxID=133412 RepID=A0A1R1Y2G9_9FUNG|nr:hypothetical protein AYI70_g3641 [Smittium culicis]